MANQLNTTVSSQDSSNTQNPQSAESGSSINGQTQNSQPSVSGNTLNASSSVKGIPLNSSSPNVVSLGSSSTRVAPQTLSSRSHHTSPYAVSIVVILLVVAVAITLRINRSAKITTDY